MVTARALRTVPQQPVGSWSCTWPHRWQAYKYNAISVCSRASCLAALSRRRNYYDSAQARTCTPWGLRRRYERRRPRGQAPAPSARNLGSHPF